MSDISPELEKQQNDHLTRIIDSSYTHNPEMNFGPAIVKRTHDELLQTLRALSKKHTLRMKALMGDEKIHLQVA